MSRVAAAAVAISLLLGVPAVAHDHRLPAVTLRVDGVAQDGLPVESTWVRGARDGSGHCVATFADGFGWPRPVQLRSGTSVAVVSLHKRVPPMELDLRAGGDEDGDGEPELRPWPFVLRPSPATGSRAWQLVTPLPAGPRLFLELEASWRDEDGCTGVGDLGDQYGVWRFRADRSGSPDAPCTRGRVEALVRRFVRAYNRGDTEALERAWAQEPDFEWYFVQEEREGSDASNRSTLSAYFLERHTLGDRLRLDRLRVGPPNEAGHFGIAFALRRSSDDRAADGMWHGKASATSAGALPDLPYLPGGRSCVLAVWSMGRD